MPAMTQQQIRDRMRMLDDVFHRMIVSLERLEAFLEAMRLDGQSNKELQITAIKTNRDEHDDAKNPPSRDSYYGEVQLQCSALYFQTNLDDKDIFNSAVKYFLSDLLEWYGGRDESIPYNGVDAFVLPIIVSLSQQVKSVSEILEVVAKYVAIIPDMSSFSDEEKADAISNAISVLITKMDDRHHKEHNEEMRGQEVTFTEHKRGDSVEGYKRLVMAMLSLYDEAMPAIVLYRTVNNYLPEIVSAVPTITESTITKFIQEKEISVESDACNPNESISGDTSLKDENNDSGTCLQDNSTLDFSQNEGIPFQEIPQIKEEIESKSAEKDNEEQSFQEIPQIRKRLNLKVQIRKMKNNLFSNNN